METLLPIAALGWFWPSFLILFAIVCALGAGYVCYLIRQDDRNASKQLF